MRPGKLVFFCGKMGAGKSTKAIELARDKNAVLLSEDEWLASLYPGQISSLEDYIHYANLLKPQIEKLVQAILLTGVDVVMDFPANTLAQRAWFKQVYSQVGAPHSLLYLEVSDQVCLAQIDKRRGENPERRVTDTAEMFAAMRRFFIPPSAEEGFNIIKISASDELATTL